MSLLYVTLRDRPDLCERAAEWFSQKWGVPKNAYLECMEDFVSGRRHYGWYLCLEGEGLVGGLGVIDNDSHDRPDLSPNICAVYTEPEHRGSGIAGRLLDMAVDDLRRSGITPVYLVTDHVGFYERYGWEFLCMVRSLDNGSMTRLMIHR